MPKLVKFTPEMVKEDLQQRKMYLVDLIKQGWGLETALEWTSLKLKDTKSSKEYHFETWEMEEL